MGSIGIENGSSTVAKIKLFNGNNVVPNKTTQVTIISSFGLLNNPYSRKFGNENAKYRISNISY